MSSNKSTQSRTGSDWILNPNTGRMIKVGGKTYKILLRHNALSPIEENPKHVEILDQESSEELIETPIKPVEQPSEQKIPDAPKKEVQITDNNDDSSSSYSSLSFSTSSECDNEIIEKTAPRCIDIEIDKNEIITSDDESGGHLTEKIDDKCTIDVEQMSDRDIQKFYEYVKAWEMGLNKKKDTNIEPDKE